MLCVSFQQEHRKLTPAYMQAQRYFLASLPTVLSQHRPPAPSPKPSSNVCPPLDPKSKSHARVL